jgi:hypothetical protein
MLNSMVARVVAISTAGLMLASARYCEPVPAS